MTPAHATHSSIIYLDFTTITGKVESLLNGCIEIDLLEESDDARNGVTVAVDERTGKLLPIMLLDRL